MLKIIRCMILKFILKKSEFDIRKQTKEKGEDIAFGLPNYDRST